MTQLAIGQNKSYNVYIDRDNNAATGCTVQQPDFMTQFDGVDGYISVEIGSAPVSITNSLYYECQNGMFDGGSAVVTSALGLNTNLNGDDVFEVQMTTSDLGIRSSTNAKLYFSSESPTSSDIVVVNNNGGGIFAGVAFPIPAFSIASLLLLVLIIYIVARKAYKNKILIVASVLLFSTVVWGMFTFVIDGQVDDWSSFTPINDPLADNSGPGNFSDITQVFANLEQDLFTARIDVVDVENEAPTANDVLAGNVFEDNTLIILLIGADLDGDALTFSIDTVPGNGQVSVVTPINATSASVIYTPNQDYVGDDTFTYVANDGQVNSVPATVSLTVDPVNDAPSFTKGADESVLEESPAQTVLGWATAILEGPSDESSQTVSFNVSNDNNALFSVQPAVNNSGDLTYTPLADASGVAIVTINIMDDGGTANGGVDTSADQTFTITVVDINDEPSFTAGANETVLEDAGAQSVTSWATALSAGPASESGQTLSFNVSNDNNSLFSAQPSINAAGDLTYTSANDANGTAIVTVNIMDDGGTANGGDDTSADQIFSITLTAVNDAPSFTSGGNVAVLEDSGAYSQAWTSTFSAGPTDESAQTLSFNITGNTAPGLFSVAPSISSAGQLAFTPAADAFGVATITVNIMDSGGVLNGGINTSAAQMFTITLTPVNDVPSFTKGADQTFNQDSGAHTINAWATALLAGPANESTQTLSFNVTNNNNALFSVQPSVNASGDLSFTSTAATNGSAVVTINIMDNGGTTNGGVNTSANQTFNITILNPPPAKADPMFATTTNIQVNTPAGSGLLSGATGSGTLVVGNAMNPAPTTTTGGGDLSIITATGAFTYNPPAGLDTGTDTFVYKICNATQCSADITATLNLSGNTTWFIVNSMTAGDGRLTTPFNSMAAFMAQQNGGMQGDPAAGDCIFLDSGSHTGPFTLINNQIAVGKGSTTTVATECGLTPAANSVALPTTNGARPVITSAGNGVNVASGNTIRGLDIGNTSGSGIIGTGLGTLTINDMAVSGTGKAVDLTTGTAAITFDSISSTTSATEGIDLNSIGGNFAVTGSSSVSAPMTDGISIANSSGSFTFSSVTINGTGGAGIQLTSNTGVVNVNGGSIGAMTPSGSDGVNISGGVANVTIAASITQFGLNNSVDVSNRMGGTVLFSGAIDDDADGIGLSSNGGGTINFSGGLDLDTTTNTAFSATGGGTINVTGSVNTIDTTTGMGINIANTTIGASNVIFQSVTSSTSAANVGISLDTTGSSGGLIVTGNAAAGSGGTIANKTGADGSNTQGIGIYLNDTQSPSFSFMQLNDFSNFAIKGNNVTGFSLISTVINGVNGTNANPGFDEGSIRFDNLLGSAVITSSNISGGLEDNINIANNIGVLNRLTVMGSTIGLNSTTLGNDGILIESQAGAMANISVLNSVFLGARGDMVQCNAIGNSSMDCVIRDNTFNNMHPNIVSGGGGITISGGSAGGNMTMTYDVSATNPALPQPFNGALGNAITANFINGAGLASGVIQNNNIGTQAVINSGGSGISVGASVDVNHNTTISNNILRQINTSLAGIEIVGNTNGVMNTKILNNIVTMSADPGNFALSAVYLLFGGAGTETGTACTEMNGNIIDASAAPFSGSAVFVDQISVAGNHNFPGYAGTANGEFAFACAAGTASAGLLPYLSGRGNTFTDGPFPTFPGVDASIVCGVTGAGATCP